MTHTRPVHLIGHYSSSFKGYVVCSCGYSDFLYPRKGSSRLTTNTKDVTCKICLRLIRTGAELDKITRVDPTHASCLVRPTNKEDIGI